MEQHRHPSLQGWGECNDGGDGCSTVRHPVSSWQPVTNLCVQRAAVCVLRHVWITCVLSRCHHCPTYSHQPMASCSSMAHAKVHILKQHCPFVSSDSHGMQGHQSGSASSTTAITQVLTAAGETSHKSQIYCSANTVILAQRAVLCSVCCLLVQTVSSVCVCAGLQLIRVFPLCLDRSVLRMFTWSRQHSYSRFLHFLGFSMPGVHIL